MLNLLPQEEDTWARIGGAAAQPGVKFSRRRHDPSQRRTNSKSARGHMTQRESGRPYGQRDESPQEGCDGGAVRPASSASATAFQEPRAPNRRSLSLHAAAVVLAVLKLCSLTRCSPCRRWRRLVCRLNRLQFATPPLPWHRRVTF